MKRLSILLLISILIFGVSAAGAFEVTPENPTVGDRITINGTSSADSVKANVEFTKTVSVEDGEYEYRIDDVEIPKGSNTFTVKAEGAEDLNVRVKILFWITKSADASSSGVATVSQSNVPSGDYNIQIDGKAASGANDVDLTITASQNIDVENGEFEGEYNTNGIPPGQFKVTVAGETKTITLKSSGSSSGGSGSSGGGGGGSTPDNSNNNVDAEELITQRVFSDTPVNFQFSDPEVPVKSINLTSAITVMDVPVRIEVLKDVSVMVKKEPSGNVYKHINMWVGNRGFAIAENIKSAKIHFQVENDWIDNNNINPESVVLMHYEEDADQWTRLPTDMISGNEQYTLYKASATHFSPFAIAGETRQTTNTDNQTDSNQTNTTVENVQQNSSETPADSKPGLNAEWILIAGVMAGLVAMVIWKMKNNRQ
ncbi:PGF-pre-PGF domain-containing protein [Methanohalophilus mahii]|uniref:PGF-pre-PGF domain-containing protein n=1 Tax=Methanohalophilus mahii (strain ATCC 35705 / DSM 5219 / SLP) TaxID=547558 RepID=D5E904_METMS|nr:PGF-pre-PGF domain-containing protein [Methanohalophilus mahii]ADE35655.1 hypothetical protein Mmah_0119 [Methanohalophilus mahii DSM 5219]